MIWLKIFICIAVIAFSTGLGYWLSGKYRSRKDFYEQFCLFNKQYLNELSYTRKSLPDFLKEHEYKGDFAKAVKSCVEARDCSIKFSYLTEEEKSACENYLAMLGKGDALSQKNYFTIRQSTLAEKKTTCEREAKKRSDLYLKLGLLAGLAFVILII